MDLVKAYNKLAGRREMNTIDAFHPTPVPEDYKIGYIDRFFVRAGNQSNGIVTEIAPKLFDKIQSDKRFITARLRWKISGPYQTIFNEDGSVKEFGIIHANKRSIELAKKSIPNIDTFLVDYTKFYKK
jgi:hypothetical protein